MGILENYYVIPRQHAIHHIAPLKKIYRTCQFIVGARHVDISFRVLEPAAVGYQSDIVALAAQRIAQCAVAITIVAYEQYFFLRGHGSRQL
jgi:hypothetical protein